MRKEVKPMCEDSGIVIDDFNAFEPVLYKNLYVPSYVHSYSLAIEYMKKWFLSKFNSNYFKYVHINGKHMFDDYKHFNKQNVKREKPYLIITPNIEFDYDRETLDLYTSGIDIYLRRSNHEDSFFKDTVHNSYLTMRMKELKMNFNFRVKVSTRAQQLDLLDRMNLMFKVGGTITEYKSVDFVIPKDIIIDMANMIGHEVENGEIKYPTLFLQYLNTHSLIPFTYKLRNINNKLEYFVRLDNIFCNIWLSNKLSVDDGEREGHLDNNFAIDLECTLRMAVPHFFVLYSRKQLYTKIKTDKGTIGFYSLSQFKINPINENGWETFMNTDYRLDDNETFIDMSEVLNGTKLQKVINHCMEKGYSPSTFIDIKVYREMAGEYPLIYSKMNYNKSVLEIENLHESQFIYIVIYIDKLYFNEELNTIEKMEGRVN